MNQDFHYHGANWTGAGWSAECRVLMAFVGGGLIGYGLSQKAPAACILGTLGLALAAEAGVKFNGVLCGRATWKDGIPVYAKQGPDAFRKWLQNEGVQNISNVNERLKAATPWFSLYEVREPAMAGD